MTIEKTGNTITINGISFTLVSNTEKTTQELLEYFKKDIQNHNRLKDLLIFN